MAQDRDRGDVDIAEQLLGCVPSDGTPIGNQALKQAFARLAGELGLPVDDAAFEQAKQSLIDKGLLVKGRGRGGSVRRAQHHTGDFALNPTEQPPEPPPSQPPKAVNRSPASRPAPKAEEPEVLSYRHANRRKNNPEVGMVTRPPTRRAPSALGLRSAYRPRPAVRQRTRRHRDADRRCAGQRRRRADARGAGGAEAPAVALSELDRQGRAHQLRGRHRLAARARAHRPGEHPGGGAQGDEGRRQGEGRSKAIQPGLFDAPFENLPLRDAIDFYHHDTRLGQPPDRRRLAAGDELACCRRRAWPARCR